MSFANPHCGANTAHSTRTDITDFLISGQSTFNAFLQSISWTQMHFLEFATKFTFLMVIAIYIDSSYETKNGDRNIERNGQLVKIQQVTSIKMSSRLTHMKCEVWVVGAFL